VGALRHTITDENRPEAIDAIRNILLLYVDMAESYGGFGHAVDADVRFDPLRFVDAVLDTPPGRAPLVDLDLLRGGSAVAILCFLYDEWCEFETVTGGRYREAILSGRLSATPDIEQVARTALARGDMALEDPWFDAALGPIYRKYVARYFAELGGRRRGV
jgi:hypothetical protein